jgi:putative aldouronate transport system substrate-binding protein
MTTFLSGGACRPIKYHKEERKKHMKKGISILLCLILALTSLCLSAAAAEKPAITILALLNSSTSDLNQNPFLTQMAQDANLDITYDLAYYDDWDTKKSTILASGELPDAFVGGAVLTYSDIALNADMFMPLKDLIKQYAPNIQAAIDSDPTYAKIVTDIDGEIRYLTNYVPYRPQSYTTLYINKAWLDKLGLGMPTTTDELESVLIKFRDSDPNGNGQKDEFPMYMGFADDEAFGIRGIMGAFDCATSCGSSWLTLENGKITFVPTKDKFITYANWLSKLNGEGLLSEEIVTAGWDLRMSRICAEPAMVGLTNLWTIGYLPVNTQKEYVQLPPFSGPEGDNYVPYNFINMAYNPIPKFAMSAANPHPAETIKFIDQFFIPVNAAQINYGPIGITLKEENGVLVFQQAPEGMDSEHWTFLNSMNESWPFYLKDDESFLAVPYTNMEKLASDKINAPYFKPDSVVPPLKFTVDTNEELAPLEADINSFVLSSLADWFVNGGVDSAKWEAYVSQLKDMGLDRYLEIYQQAYDQQK